MNCVNLANPSSIGFLPCKMRVIPIPLGCCKESVRTLMYVNCLAQCLAFGMHTINATAIIIGQINSIATIRARS